MAYLIKIILHILLTLLILNKVFAYQPDDTATVNLSLPKDWVMKPRIETDTIKVFEYRNPAIKAPLREEFAQSIVKKGPEIKSEQEIFTSVMMRFMGSNVCENLDSDFVEEDIGAPFGESFIYYYCKKEDINIAVAIVDADPSTIYMFVYQASRSLGRGNLVQRLAEMLKICYKSGCYTLIPDNTTTIKAILPEGWEQNNLSFAHYTTPTMYVNRKSKPPEDISQQTMAKDPKLSLEEHFKKIPLTITKVCPSAKFRQVKTNSTVPFSEWVSVASCSADNRVVTVAVDSNSNNLYFFWYFAGESFLSENQVLQKLSEIIQICYKKDKKENECYFLLKP
jgi:hypothetical protein